MFVPKQPHTISLCATLPGEPKEEISKGAAAGTPDWCLRPLRASGREAVTLRAMAPAAGAPTYNRLANHRHNLPFRESCILHYMSTEWHTVRSKLEKILIPLM